MPRRFWPLNFWRSDAMGPADFEWFENHYPGWYDAHGGFWEAFRQLAHPSSGRLVRNQFRLVEWQGSTYAACSEGCEWIFRTWPQAHAGR